MDFDILIKMLGLFVTFAVAITTIYKFFWKAPSEKEAKQANDKVEAISIRFVALFESLGVHRNHIAEFFGHGFDIPSCAADEVLLK